MSIKIGGKIITLELGFNVVVLFSTDTIRNIN